MATRSKKAQRRPSLRLVISVACLFVLLAAAGLGLVKYGPGWAGAIQARIDPDRVALQAALKDSEVSDFRSAYAVRYFKPIWLKRGEATPEASALIDRLKASSQDGLHAEDYETPKLDRAMAGLPGASRAQKARTELLLSKTYADYVADLHAPTRAADMLYTDKDLSPSRPIPRIVVYRLAKARTVNQGIEQATRMNALYLQYRKALADHRKTAPADAATERLLLVNLERIRALPVNLGQRFMLVDAASGQLLLYENDRVTDTMKVVVGTPDQQTPAMGALVRYAVFNPYWNVPPDMTRETYAPRIAAHPAALTALQMDAWSDYTPQARKLNPTNVNWRSVALGGKPVWLRQRPGPHNSMGAVKFMLPNELGIYLHDTPNKALFAQARRTFSAGCIRVEDYKRLARWLYRGAEVGPKSPEAEQRVDLPAPTAVYITYLTAALENGKVAVRPDVYGRDAAVAAQLGARERRPVPHVERPARTLELRRLTPPSDGLL